MTLIATRRPSALCTASNTLPIPPSPITRVSWYGADLSTDERAFLHHYSKRHSGVLCKSLRGTRGSPAICWDIARLDPWSPPLVRCSLRRSGGARRARGEVRRLWIVRLIGRGGMGAVYEAMNANISRRPQSKFSFPNSRRKTTRYAASSNEARAVNTINHPGVVQVSDVGKRPTAACIWSWNSWRARR